MFVPQLARFVARSLVYHKMKVHISLATAARTTISMPLLRDVTMFETVYWRPVTQAFAETMTGGLLESVTAPTSSI